MIHDLLKIAGSVGEVVELIGVLVIVSGFVIALFSVTFFPPVFAGVVTLLVFYFFYIQ